MVPKSGTFARALFLLYQEGADLQKAQRDSEDRLLIGKEHLERLERELAVEQQERPAADIEGTSFTGAKVESLQTFLLEKDWRTARLPMLDASILKDQNAGLWELAVTQPPTDEYLLVELDASWESQDPQSKFEKMHWLPLILERAIPSLRLQKTNRYSLLRLGIEDWFEDVRTDHYENPTLLEFADNQSLDLWKTMPHRPPMHWDEVRAAHTVKANMQDSASGVDSDFARRVLSRIKLWVREGQESASL